MCNLVIKLEVSYQVNLHIPWPWGRAPQPQQHQAAAESTDEVHIRPVVRQQPTANQLAPECGGRLASARAATDSMTQQHQQALAGPWHHHSARSAGEGPYQETLAGNWRHQASASAADDYYAPGRSDANPQLAQDRLEASGQARALVGGRPLLRGFAASALGRQAPSSDPASSAYQWGRARSGNSPAWEGQAGAGPSAPVLPGQNRQGLSTHGRNHLLSTAHHEGRSHRDLAEIYYIQPEAAQQEEQWQEAVSDRQQVRQRPLRGNWSPAGLMHRMMNRGRHRNREALVRANSSHAGRVSHRTDLADASAMPAAN